MHNKTFTCIPLLYNNSHSETLMQSSISKLDCCHKLYDCKTKKRLSFSGFTIHLSKTFILSPPLKIPLLTYILCHKVKALRNNEYSSGFMTSYYHVITTECMIISNL